MKMQVEVEINETSIENQIKNEMLEQISEDVSIRISKEVYDEAQKRINSTIDDVVGKVIEGMMNREVVVTDQWGDPKKSVKIEDLVKEKFDNATLEQVDERGKPTGYGGVPRIEYLTNKLVKKATEEMTRTIIEDVSTKVETILKSQIKDGLTENIVKKFELDKVIDNVIKAAK